MNDLESKLCALTFREPPPGWRGSMVNTALAEPRRSKWFAPHPAAWAALAAIWLVLALISRSFDTSSPSTALASVNRKNSDPPSAPTLMAWHRREMDRMEPPL